MNDDLDHKRYDAIKRTLDIAIERKVNIEVTTEQLAWLLALAQSYLDYLDSLAAVDTSDQDVV